MLASSVLVLLLLATTLVLSACSIVDFGKYRKRKYSFQQVLLKDPGYCNWVLGTRYRYDGNKGSFDEFRTWLIEQKGGDHATSTVVWPSGTRIANVIGSSSHKSSSSWSDEWIAGTGLSWPSLCSFEGCAKAPTVGGHLWIERTPLSEVHIAPICASCNAAWGAKDYDGDFLHCIRGGTATLKVPSQLAMLETRQTRRVRAGVNMAPISPISPIVPSVATPILATPTTPTTFSVATLADSLNIDDMEHDGTSDKTWEELNQWRIQNNEIHKRERAAAARLTTDRAINRDLFRKSQYDHTTASTTGTTNVGVGKRGLFSAFSVFSGLLRFRWKRIAIRTGWFGLGSGSVLSVQMLRRMAQNAGRSKDAVVRLAQLRQWYLVLGVSLALTLCHLGKDEM
jgi:hypothetical protein